MVWVKGSNLDYDGWQLPGWGWDDVAPVFARIERGADAGRPRAVSRRAVPIGSSPQPVRQASPPTMTSADPNSTVRRSRPVTIHNGQRWSTARGYLRAPEESDRRHQGRGAPGDHPQWSCGRRRVPPSRTRAAGLRRPGGRRERRRLRHAAAVAVVGHRSGGSPPPRRDHPARRQPPRRPRPHRPPACVGDHGRSRPAMSALPDVVEPKMVAAVAVTRQRQARQ